MSDDAPRGDSWLVVSDDVVISKNEFEFEAMRASGPGGQHVNKTSSAVRLSWDVAATEVIEPDVKARLKRYAGRRLGTDGVLRISARRFRSQDRNRQDALERLAILVRRALAEPRRRKKTRPTRASQQQRLEEKSRRSQTKTLRRKVDRGDEG